MQKRIKWEKPLPCGCTLLHRQSRDQNNGIEITLYEHCAALYRSVFYAMELSVKSLHCFCVSCFPLSLVRACLSTHVYFSVLRTRNETSKVASFLLSSRVCHSKSHTFHVVIFLFPFIFKQEPKVYGTRCFHGERKDLQKVFNETSECRKGKNGGNDEIFSVRRCLALNHFSKLGEGTQTNAHAALSIFQIECVSH